MRVLVVDENDGARKSIFFHLNNIEGVEEIIEISEFSEALKFLNSEKVDLAFLSEELGGQNILKLLDVINGRNFELVLVAKNSDLAVKAIGYNPKAFLIKPVSKDEVEQIVEDVLEKKGGLDRHILLPINTVQNDSIVLRIARGFSVFRLTEIEKITSFGAYSKLFLNEGSTHIVNGSLHSLESILSPKIFFRIHSSTIVNLNHVRSFIKEKNDGKVIMRNGEELKVSRTHKDKLSNLQFLE